EGCPCFAEDPVEEVLDGRVPGQGRDEAEGRGNELGEFVQDLTGQGRLLSRRRLRCRPGGTRGASGELFLPNRVPPDDDLCRVPVEARADTGLPPDAATDVLPRGLAGPALQPLGVDE